MTHQKLYWYSRIGFALSVILLCTIAYLSFNIIFIQVDFDDPDFERFPKFKNASYKNWHQNLIVSDISKPEQSLSEA
jgi:hypothetical protein